MAKSTLFDEIIYVHHVSDLNLYSFINLSWFNAPFCMVKIWSPVVKTSINHPPVTVSARVTISSHGWFLALSFFHQSTLLNSPWPGHGPVLPSDSDIFDEMAMRPRFSAWTMVASPGPGDPRVPEQPWWFPSHGWWKRIPITRMDDA